MLKKIKYLNKIYYYIRDNQEKLFELNDIDKRALSQELKPGQYVSTLTSFDCEILCCQNNVFNRFKQEPELINRRKLNVIKEQKLIKSSNKSNLLVF